MSNALFLLSLSFSPAARAQMDPSTALLLRGPVAPPSLEALTEEVHVAPKRAPGRVRPRIEITHAPVDDVVPAAAPTALTPARDVSSRRPANAEDSPTTREQLLSLRLGVGYFALDSHRGLPARSYLGGGPGLKLGITLWATSAFGLKADYLTTVGGSVRGRNGRRGLDHQEVDAHLVYRSARVGPRWLFGVGVHQNENQIARTPAGPVGGRSIGPDLGATLVSPANLVDAYVFEAHVQPYLFHREIGSADRESSGDPGAAFGWSLAVGTQHDQPSGRRVFWRLRFALEHDAFANRASVDVGQTWLTLGCNWGS